PPCPARSPCPSPSMLIRRTIRGPLTGFFQTAVCTVLPCQVTSRGSPTLTESRTPACCTEVTEAVPVPSRSVSPGWPHPIPPPHDELCRAELNTPTAHISARASCDRYSILTI